MANYVDQKGKYGVREHRRCSALLPPRSSRRSSAAVIREAAAKAAHKAILERARGNADNPAPFPAPPAPPARRQVGIAAAFSCVVTACVEIIWNS